LHTGVLVDKQWCYPYPAEGKPVPRTRNSIAKNAEEFAKTSSKSAAVGGVSGPHGFKYMSCFDVVKGFSPDYLENCLGGFLRTQLARTFGLNKKEKAAFPFARKEERGS
jgi:hypothetical protein